MFGNSKRTIRRNIKMNPLNRTLQARMARDEIEITMLDLTIPIAIGKATDFCEYIGICHYTCFRSDAKNCSTYEKLYGKIGIQENLFQKQGY